MDLHLASNLSRHLHHSVHRLDTAHHNLQIAHHLDTAHHLHPFVHLRHLDFGRPSAHHLLDFVHQHHLLNCNPQLQQSVAA